MLESLFENSNLTLPYFLSTEVFHIKVIYYPKAFLLSAIRIRKQELFYQLFKLK